MTSYKCPLEGAPDITHGICEPCRERMLCQEVGLPLRSFLDTLPGPILLVDKDGKIMTGNQEVQYMLNKELPQIENQDGGTVMECAYSRLPEGCGNTEHCRACAIRRTVMETHATGRAQNQIPCYQDIETADGVKRMRFTITTERVLSVVLLRIDSVEV